MKWKHDHYEWYYILIFGVMFGVAMSFAFDNFIMAIPVGFIFGLSIAMALGKRHRAEVDGGTPIDAVLASAGRSLFFKDKPAVTRQLGRWPSDRLAIAIGRTLAAERAMKASGSLGADAVHETLFGIAQAAARRR